MNKFCALTGEVTDLKASHIIPKFFYADLKKKGGCYFRSTYNPKLEHKDGIKIPLLGNKAELLFSKQEKWFKENVFDYYHNKLHIPEHTRSLSGSLLGYKTIP